MHWQTRAHEWAADHFSFIQYPRIRRHQATKPAARLSFGERVALGTIGLFMVLVSAVAVLAGLFVVWAVVSSLFP